MRPRVLLSAASVLALAGTTILGVAAFGDSSSGDGGEHGHRGDLLRAPVTGSLPSDAPVAGVNAGAAPWVNGPSKVRVRPDGEVRLSVRGLAIPGRGVGPVTTVSASLVCGGVVVDTSSTAPLSSSGDARLRDRLTVPDRCTAPVVLVSPNGNPAVYIAVSGSQR